MTELYPLLLTPSLHTKVWGGRKLETVLGLELPTNEPYGEAWLVHDTSTVTNGTLAGKTLGDLTAEYGTTLIGDGNNPIDGFPLLAKILDAADWLSVQVHPNDEQAARLESDPRGKTEAWLILEADADAQLVIGLQSGTTQESMANAIRENTLEDLLVYASVKAGDVLFVAANTVHAIGAGNLLYEIQQSSDITYRLYDWGRMGLDGNPRQLHIEKGVQVSNLETIPPIAHPTGAELVRSTYFVTERLKETMTRNTNGKFHALTCVKGEMRVSAQEIQVSMNMGQSVLIPASIPHYDVSGDGELYCSYQP